jgi:hypothetical protein
MLAKYISRIFRQGYMFPKYIQNDTLLSKSVYISSNAFSG